MSVRHSAGLLLYRHLRPGVIEVLIGHMGGPFWARKDDGAWSIPKGEHSAQENPLQAARREFEEELGYAAPDGEPLHLGAVRQPRGKIIEVWALQGDIDVSEIHGNTFEMQWPPGSGQMREFPEIDRAGWFDLDRAKRKLVPGQIPFLEELTQLLAEEKR